MLIVGANYARRERPPLESERASNRRSTRRSAAPQHVRNKWRADTVSVNAQSINAVPLWLKELAPVQEERLENAGSSQGQRTDAQTSARTECKLPILRNARMASWSIPVFPRPGLLDLTFDSDNPESGTVTSGSHSRQVLWQHLPWLRQRPPRTGSAWKGSLRYVYRVARGCIRV